MPNQTLTRRERLKSALYLRLKKALSFLEKGFLKLQFAAKYQKTWRGDRLATKEKFENFLKKIQKNEKMKILEVSQCRKTRKGDPLGFLKLQFAAKYQILEGGPFGDKKCRKKVAQCRKNSRGPIVSSGFASYVTSGFYQVSLVSSLSIRTLFSLYLVSIHYRSFGLYFRKLRMVTLHLGFIDIHSVAKRHPFETLKKFRKKSHSAEKKRLLQKAIKNC